MRNNRARYQLELELTELQRDRSYLEYLMTDRTEAKEIRSYDIAPTLRALARRAVGHAHGARCVRSSGDGSR